MNNTPRVLVCSVNSWNSKVGDNTFSTLLEDCSKENIAVVFIREDEPDSTVCNKYFRISEGAVIKSILNPKVITGRQIIVAKNQDKKKVSEALANAYKNKAGILYYPKLVVREVLWYLGKWKSKELDLFVDDFKPDIVLFEMSRYIHLNRIIRYIINRTGAKGVGCFWDDTFTYKQEKGLAYKFLRFFQRRSLRELSKCTSDFFAITPKTKREADAFLGINSVVLTKPMLSEEAVDDDTIISDPIKLLYTGNLGIGRLDTLKLIVQAISGRSEFTLDVYTNTYILESDIKKIETNNSHIHDAVSQEEVFKLQRDADVLLFLEDVSEDNLIARLSFSTKITDYYSAGKCIFAVGNKDLAPMELLEESNSALIAYNVAEIANCVDQLKKEEVIRYYAERSRVIGREMHSIEAIKKIFWDVLLR